MPFDGNGNYSPPSPAYPAIAGAVITALNRNTIDADLANALSNVVTRDGQSPPTANLPMGTRKLTGLAAGATAGDSLRWQQLFSQGVELDLASAATTDIGAQNTNFLHLTGAAAITSFGTNYNGPRFLRLAAGITLTYNAASLLLPGGANIVALADDCCIAVPKATAGVPDGWEVISYGSSTKAGGRAVLGSGVIGDQLFLTATAAAARALITAAASGANNDITSLSALTTDGLRNRLINANFKINQRGAVAGSIGAGVYVMDRWKAGAGGCTFSLANSGNDVIVTITAGSLMQVIEDLNIEGGVYALANRGTAQARIAINGAATSGAYAAASTAAPLTTAAATALQAVTVEFTTGTLDKVQLEPGAVATTFERRPFHMELALCQRYYEKSFDYSQLPTQSAGIFTGSSVALVAGTVFAGNATISWRYKADKRATPTIVLFNPRVGGTANCITDSSGGDSSATNLTNGTSGAGFYNSGGGLAASAFCYVQWTASSEL